MIAGKMQWNTFYNIKENSEKTITQVNKALTIYIHHIE